MADVNKLLVLLSVCLCAVAQRPINRIVTSQCYKSSKDNTLTTYFTAQLNNDDINNVFGLELIPGSSPEMYNKENCTFTGRADGFIYVESVINLADVTSTNPCGFMQVMSNEVNPTLEGITWRLALRKVENTHLHYQDRDYLWMCNISIATDTWLTTNVQVVDSLEKPLEPVKPTVTFHVIPQSAAQNVNPISSCTVGDKLQLELIFEVPAYLDYLKPWGIYSFNTMVNYENNFQAGSGADILIKANGCKKDPNLLSMLYSFKEAFQFMSTGPAPNDLTFKTRSGVFTCRKYQNQGSLFFTTTIGTCSGIRTGANRDQKCVDLCGTNVRKRREAEGNFTHMITSITVVDATSDRHQTTDGLSTTMIIIVATVLVVALIVLVLAVAFFCMAARKRLNNREKLSSRASSERSLPIKF